MSDRKIIYVDDVINVLNSKRVSEDNRHRWREYRNDNVDMVIEIIQSLPPAQAERPKGKWITQEFGSWAECSECHELYDIPIAYSNFCPHCGADMRKKERREG